METNHKPLEWLEATKASKSRSQRLERWSLELRAFQFSITHRPGAENQHADALSRHPLQVMTVESSLENAAIAQAQRSEQHIRYRKKPACTINYLSYYTSITQVNKHIHHYNFSISARFFQLIHAMVREVPSYPSKPPQTSGIVYWL